MSNEVKKLDQEQRNLDGFSGFEDGVEGSGEQSNSRIQGPQIKFSNDFRWHLPEDEAFPRDTELVASNIVRVAQRWGEDRTKGPIEDRELAPGERFPDFGKLNAAIPQSEWLEGYSGELRGPWQGAFFLYLVDPITLNHFTYIANLNTVGACIAIRELADKVGWIRRLRHDENIYAVITLSDAFMNTRFGGRQRPHFQIKRWIRFGEGGSALPIADAPKLAGPTPAETPKQTPDKSVAASDGTQTVAPVTAKEATGDEIPW